MSQFVIESPIGKIQIETQGDSVSRMERTGRRSTNRAPQSTFEKQIKKQIDEYFSGRRKEFEFKFKQEGTEFQKKVWKVLSSIPYGQSMTYGEVAKKIGNPGAARAVGTACGANHLLVLVPCHRVKATQGLGGFALGLKAKRKLLSIEDNH